ncbi:MAG: helix-turn-helix domain-containing protein [Magnetococcales bacterium]|nr:helix-turn-helix domain-containing protein [Magnetococcales bacterium]MBF0115506.1 helix-turn-helix domain-containing protein [Magnetococcales bacterium]
MEIKHITPFHLAQRWRITPKTLQNWRCDGKGPPYLKIGGRIVYRLEDVERYEITQRRNVFDKS